MKIIGGTAIEGFMVDMTEKELDLAETAPEMEGLLRVIIDNFDHNPPNTMIGAVIDPIIIQRIKTLLDIS